MSAFDRLAVVFRAGEAHASAKVAALVEGTRRFLAALRVEHGDAGDHYAARFESGLVVMERASPPEPWEPVQVEGVSVTPISSTQFRVHPPPRLRPGFPWGLTGSDNLGRIVQFHRDGDDLIVTTGDGSTELRAVVHGPRHAA